MSTSRYYAQIKRIIHDQAPTQPVVDIHWYDFDYLKQTILAYLIAKQTRLPLSKLEQNFIAAAEAEINEFFVEPTLPVVDELAALDQEDSNFDDAPDEDKFINIINRRSVQSDKARAIGQSLKPESLNGFSLTPQTDWVPAPFNRLDEILSGYSEAHDLSAGELQAIFGEDLVDAYWENSSEVTPKSPLITFIPQLRDMGYWMLDLVDMLNTKTDTNIVSLVILWLRWFKHAKTCHGMEVQDGAHTKIRMAKHLITLLNQRRYSEAGTLLIKTAPYLWD